MNLPPEKNATTMTVELLYLDQAFQDPKFKALLSEGYQIVDVIPVEDQGVAKAIFIFAPNSSDMGNEILSHISWRTKAGLLLLSLIFIALSAITILLIQGTP